MSEATSSLTAVPSFAIVGAVNHGKSSLVSSLAEDDAVRISAMPGETVDNQRFALRELLVLHDTPGFQNARKALDEILQAPKAGAPLAAFADFVRRHRDDPEFDAECRLLEPVLAGAGVIYVVDGSRPVKDIHRCEMELLRLTGAPRLAVINRRGGNIGGDSDSQHADEWKPLLGQHFNAVREFDAHRATFTDRKDLLEALANIEREWKPPLLAAAQILEQERDAKLDEAAGITSALLIDCLRYRESAPLETLDAADAARRESASAALLNTFKAGMAAKERRAHEAIIRLHAHSRVSAGSHIASFFGDDLFSESTWKMFGLDARQLTGAGAVAGAAAGASLDVLTAGHTLLAGSAIGAALGAGSAHWLGKRRPELSVRMPTGALPRALHFLVPDKLTLGGGELSVGPIDALNFPWILIDRAACTLAYVATRSHARRDIVELNVEAIRPRLAALRLTVADWSAEERKRCERVFTALRRGKPLKGDEQSTLQLAIRQQFGRIAAAEPSSLSASEAQAL